MRTALDPTVQHMASRMREMLLRDMTKGQERSGVVVNYAVQCSERLKAIRADIVQRFEAYFLERQTSEENELTTQAVFDVAALIATKLLRTALSRWC